MAANYHGDVSLIRHPFDLLYGRERVDLALENRCSWRSNCPHRQSPFPIGGIALWIGVTGPQQAHGPHIPVGCRHLGGNGSGIAARGIRPVFWLMG